MCELSKGDQLNAVPGNLDERPEAAVGVVKAELATVQS